MEGRKEGRKAGKQAPAASLSLEAVQVILRACVARTTRRACDREDRLQDINLRLLTSPPDLSRVRNLYAYLNRIAVNHAIRAGHREARAARLHAELGSQVRASALDSSPAVMPREFLGGLRPRDRAVWMAWCESGSSKGSARVLGLDVRQVKRSLQRIAAAVLAARRPRHFRPHLSP